MTWPVTTKTISGTKPLVNHRSAATLRLDSKAILTGVISGLVVVLLTRFLIDRRS